MIKKIIKSVDEIELLSDVDKLMAKLIHSDDFVIMACKVDGKPSSCIAMVTERGDYSNVLPLFVRVHSSMEIVSVDGKKCDLKDMERFIFSQDIAGGKLNVN